MFRTPVVLDRKTRYGDYKNLRSNKFIELYNSVGTLLLELLTSYADGDFADVSQKLSLEIFNDISTKLYNQITTSNTHKDVERFRVLFTYVLQGLQQSVYQYGTLLNTISQLETCTAKNEILDDMDKLRAYLESLQKGHIFPQQNLPVMKAVLKPKYAKYLELYGMPETMIFDPDKLAQIALELGEDV